MQPGRIQGVIRAERAGLGHHAGTSPRQRSDGTPEGNARLDLTQKLQAANPDRAKQGSGGFAAGGNDAAHLRKI
jgi:hypothetical protein